MYLQAAHILAYTHCAAREYNGATCIGRPRMSGEDFRFGEFELDGGAFELRRAGQTVHLERIPFELLCLLLERNGQLVTRGKSSRGSGGKMSTSTPRAPLALPSAKFAKR